MQVIANFAFKSKEYIIYIDTNFILLKKNNLEDRFQHHSFFQHKFSFMVLVKNVKKNTRKEGNFLV